MINKRVFKLKKNGEPDYCCYCRHPELIENYDKAMADTTQVWDCHHRMELIATGAVVDSTAQDLKDWGIYYDRPASELIFLTHAQHTVLHNKDNKYSLGKKRSEETKAKMSTANKGKPSWNKGKKLSPLSEEHKAKVSASMKGKKHIMEKKHWKLVDGHRVWY